jgi:hypothetical protein
MSAKNTISKVVMVPGEYKERLRGYFNPEFTSNVVPDSRKRPLIYVTRPDGVEDEIWVPPAGEFTLDRSNTTDSDDSASTYSRKSVEMEDATEIASDNGDLLSVNSNSLSNKTA